MSMEIPLLKMENIGKEYFGNRVLQGVTFSLRPGEIMGLVGENGAGKSTLMNILFGMPVIQETGGYEGKIIIDGQEVHFKDPLDALEAGIGMVHQEFSLIPGFTATENILLNRESVKYNALVEVFGERLMTLNRPDMRSRAEKAIKTLGVDLSPETLISEMPVGHKQFTEIAREIDRRKTRLLVLDEPTAVLAESEATVLISALKTLSKQGIALIFISHRLQEIIDLCDKLIVLRDGRVIQEAYTKDTNVRQIASWMVDRKGDKAEEEKAEKTGKRSVTLFCVRSIFGSTCPERRYATYLSRSARARSSASVDWPDRERLVSPTVSWDSTPRAERYSCAARR